VDEKNIALLEGRAFRNQLMRKSISLNKRAFKREAEKTFALKEGESKGPRWKTKVFETSQIQS